MHWILKIYLFFFFSLLESTEYLSPRLAARKAVPMKESPFFLVLCTDAPHFNYEDGSRFVQSWRKHPQGARKDGTVGHAWILLGGFLDGKRVYIEGGHSGERGVHNLTYMEGVDALARQGDPNPIRYLFEPLNDGYFEKGPGTHLPTFAAKVDLTQEQFLSIVSFINPRRYPYKTYSLTGRQCASFVVQVAGLAGISIESEVTLNLPATFCFRGESVILYRDERFSKITFSSPDMIEQELIRLVKERKAECALDWYFFNSLERTHSFLFQQLP